MSKSLFQGTVAVCLAASFLAAAAASAEEISIDSYTFGGLQARALGPAVTSGRIAAIAGAPGDPETLYVGAAGGGVWKSADGGVAWRPVFDEHTQSIGAIAVDPSHPETVWVGTGESWTRNSVSVGTGVYKSTDGGDHWEAVGLADSERIAQIVVDPQKGDTVYVCATGHLWNDNDERGVYKTTDGGKSWKAVLQVDSKTGCSDLSIDPQNPRILYAGLWQFRRYPDHFVSGGPGSGLYRSTDGGDTWKKIEEGLPSGEKGRIAVAVAPSRPSVVYALVEAKETALYRSEDLGEHWVKVNDSFNVKARPFYFARVVVDPTDWDRVYKPGLTLGMSSDGGQSFTSPFSGDGFGGGVHSDGHAVWVNPQRPGEVLLGTDGGVYQSFDRGHHWRFIAALPVAQFYHVSYDLEWPYHVYGGLQDNGSWMAPSRGVGGIENKDWDNIGAGDGFWAFVDPHDPNDVYVEYQGGNVFRYRRSTGETKEIRPYPAPGEPKYRFNWNTPIHVSPGGGAIYLGAQFLFRSRDHGESWERISPDLTTNNPEWQRQEESGGLTIDNSSAEAYTTIYAISESPKNGDVLWVGTDDGNLQLSRDGGASWTNVVGNVPGLPPNTWVSSIDAGHFAEGTAYVTFDGHRRGDMTSYVFKTTDFGATWEPLAGGGVEGYAHVVKEDLVDPDLLFVGTERGLFLSLDGGSHWARFTGNLPPVPVRDLAIQPQEGDLLVATHGRGIYVLDDLTPIRALTRDTLASNVTLLPSRPAAMVLNANVQSFSGDDQFSGSNPPEAAEIVYYLKKRHIFGDLKVEIYDASGKLITTLPGGKRRGINRVDWPMRLPPPKVPPASSLAPAFIGPRVPEGTYTVKLIKGKETYEGKVELVPDPRSTHSAEDRALQQKTSLALYDLLGRLTYVVDATADLRDQAKARAATLSDRDRVARELGAYADELESFRASLVATSEAGWLSGEEKLREKLAAVYSGVSSYDGRPTDSQLARTEALRGELEKAERRFAALSGERLGPLNRRLAAKKLEPLAPLTHEAWEEKQKASGGGGSVVEPEELGELLSGLPLAGLGVL